MIISLQNCFMSSSCLQKPKERDCRSAAAFDSDARCLWAFPSRGKKNQTRRSSYLVWTFQLFVLTLKLVKNSKNKWISFTQLMSGLLKVTQSSNDVSTSEISLSDLQVKWKMYKYLWTSFTASVCWSLKESNLVVVIGFSPQSSIVAPAEYTTSSLPLSLFQWGHLSSLIIKNKIIPCDGHWPRTPCLPN